MSYLAYSIAGVFLPLFPLSMLFNVLYARYRQPLLRSLLLLLWPQIGLTIIGVSGMSIPPWLLVWALLSALLYALRTLSLREIGVWTSFVGTSAWALLWILLANGETILQLSLYAFGISVPLVLMAMLSSALEHRFGAAYLGLYGGLAQSIPRFSGILVMVVLAIVATPLFPTFFTMLSMILTTTPKTPLLAIGIALVWLLWSWAGARLLSGLLAGPVRQQTSDLSQTSLWIFIVVLAGLSIVGIWMRLML